MDSGFRHGGKGVGNYQVAASGTFTSPATRPGLSSVGAVWEPNVNY